MTLVTLVQDNVNGDWEGLYLGDALHSEGHSLSAKEILQAVDGRQVAFMEILWIESEDTWDELGYHLPEKLSELRKVLDASNPD